MPFEFLKRRKPDGSAAAAKTGAAAGRSPASLHLGTERGVPFTALTEDWRLQGRMQITGRLSDALNRREAIAITDVSWGPPDAGAGLEPAPGLKSVDPYDLILITAGESSLPPLTDTERAALKVHKVAYDVGLEAPPFRVVGTVFLHPGAEPESLLSRSSEMFVPVLEAVARLGDTVVTDADIEVILVNRFYIRGVPRWTSARVSPTPRCPAGRSVGSAGRTAAADGRGRAARPVWRPGRCLADVGCRSPPAVCAGVPVPGMACAGVPCA